MPESIAQPNEPFGTFDLNNTHDLRRLRHALPSPVGLIERPGALPAAFEVTAIGDADLLRNGTIGQDGRAALALGLLGGEDRLVWYRAGAADSASTTPA